MEEGRGYKKAGVDIEAADEAVKRLKEIVRSTFSKEVLTDIGGFSGLFALEKEKYSSPILVSATDGVGTKLMVAQALEKHDTVGIDLVAMCVNDVCVLGAKPLFFLDYLACGKLVPEKVAEIVKGIAEGCKLAGCALIGGETAEMPGFYGKDQYDLAGFCVGIVDEGKVIDGSKIKEGDVILGLSSSGLHSNGYSLVRRVLLEEEKMSLEGKVAKLGRTLGEELLEPTRIYAKSLIALTNEVEVHGLAHITGGGFYGNISRILPKSLDAIIDKNSWGPPPIFKLVAQKGKVSEEEMYEVFNMGIGMVVILPEEEVEKAIGILTSCGEKVFKIGKIASGSKTVKIS